LRRSWRQVADLANPSVSAAFGAFIACKAYGYWCF
jgi:hypothetical protein